MSSDTLISEPRITEFRGTAENRIVAHFVEPEGALKGCVLLSHGGGQTRHSWLGTANALAMRGWLSVTIDQRGHGDSDWIESGEYGFEAFAGDVGAVAEQVRMRWGHAPVAIGASLGGIASLLAAGGSEKSNISALVLVDITPRVRVDGVQKVLGFMAAHAEQGFATLEDAADSISAYLPHRPRPKDLSGLAKNLRKSEDGRYRWHWDPRFLDSRENATRHVEEITTKLEDAARQVKIPLLLVRGRESELVGEAEAKALLDLAPHAKLADVSGARHMVAGDRNDVFTDAVLAFLQEN